MESYPSCHYIQYGLNFYPNDTLKICCFTKDAAVNACKTTEPIETIIENIFRKKAAMMRDFHGGNIYDCCKNCSGLSRQPWGEMLKQVSSITLNHFMFCNLKCGHCGYLEEMKKTALLDTDHQRVLEIINQLKAHNVLAPNVSFDIGGGEPSLSEGLLKIVQYCIENNHPVHINSNGARYVESIVSGVNKGLIKLTLTPDAGSREVFLSIKGKDNFRHTWENIEKYVHSCPANVSVKFILQEGNLGDINNMVEMCASAGVREVVLSLDLRINKERHGEYADHVSTFRSLAASKSLIVHRSPLLPQYLWQH